MGGGTSNEEELRQQLIEARQRQMEQALARLWELNLGERPPAGSLRLKLETEPTNDGG